MTRKTALAFGIGASLILAAGTASANCATEVHALQQQLDAIDMPTAASDMPTAAGSTEISPTSTDPTVEDRLSQSGTGINPTWSSNDPGEPVVHNKVLGVGDTSDTMTSDSSSTVARDTAGSPPIGTDQTGTGVNPTWSSNDPGEPPVHDDILYGDSSDTSDSSSTVAGDMAGSPPIGTDQTGTGVNPTWSSNDPGEPAWHDPAVTGSTESGVTDAGSLGATPTSEAEMATGTGTVGTGTITETTRSGEIVDPADSRSVAISSLKKAQLYADAGQEEACMIELETARQHLGVE